MDRSSSSGQRKGNKEIKKMLRHNRPIALQLSGDLKFALLSNSEKLKNAIRVVENNCHQRNNTLKKKKKERKKEKRDQ